MKPTPTYAYDESIAVRGLRMTEQRRAVYDELMAKADHPTAVEVFMRVKGKMPSISLATVYNCLQNLVDSGLIRHVHHDRESSRYCANLAEHAHLFCDRCGSVTDLPLKSAALGTEEAWDIPPQAVVLGREVSFRGFCSACAAEAAAPSAQPEARSLSQDRPAKKSKS